MEDPPAQESSDAAAARRVLLIDADDGGRDMTRGLLKLALRGDVEIAEAGDLGEAVEVLASGAGFDCVLLDCDLPGVDVPDALRRIAAACGGQGGELPCPVVVLNGSDGAARAEAVFGAGAQDRVAKQWLSPPFLRRVLENAVERFAMQRRAREQAAALAEANDRLRLAGEAAGVGHWRFDPATDTAEVDQTLAGLFGLTVEAFREPGAAFAAIHPDDRAGVRAAFERAAAGGERYAAEFRVVPPDGRERWLAGRGDVVRDESGGVAAFTGVNWDVTEWRAAEAEAGRAGRQRMLALEAADMGTFEVALPGGELTWDRRCRALFGLEDRADVTMAEGIANIHPEDRPRVERAIAAALDPAVAAEYDVEYRVAPPDRPVAWVHAVGRVTFRDDPEAPAGRAAERFVGVLTNVTDRVQAERQRELALESAQMGTWELDPAADTVAWDARCRAMFGMSDRPVMPISEALLGVHAEDRDRVRAAIDDAMDPATGGEYDVDYRVVPPDGPQRWVRATGRCTFRDGAEGGRAADRFYGVITDVTDRVEAERQRRVALESAEMGTWDLDLAAGVVRLDDRGRALQDLPAEATVEEAYARLHPDDRATVAAGIEAATDPQTGTGQYDIEYRVVGGGERWIRAVGQAVFRAGDDGRRVPERLHGVVMDVTARRAADARLREREAFNRALMEGSPDCVKVLDLDGRVLHMNGPGVEMMGYGSLGEVVGRPYADCYAGEHRAAVERCVARAAAGETAGTEARGTTATGVVRWWDVTVSPVRGEDGSIPRLLCVSRDVTERREQRQALREREARLQQALDAGGMGSFAWDVEDDDPHPDAQLMALFGVEDRLDLTLAEVIAKRVHPDDRAAHAAAVEAALDPAGDGLLLHELRIVRPDGAHRRILMQGRTRFAGDPPRAARMVGLATDVTERRGQEEALRRSERELRSVTANMPDIVARFDHDLRHLFVGGATLTRATGLTPEQVVGKSNRELGFPEAFLASWEAALRRTFETGQEQPHETPFQTPEGERFFESRMVPEFGPDGTVETVIVVVRDVTHRRRAERQMKASMEEAERANAAKDHFLAVLSHELRTPLTPVLAAAGELARREDLPADVREDLAMIRRNVELEARLMDDLLDLTRVARGKLNLELRPVDAHDKLRRVVEMVAAEAEGRRVAIDLDLAAGRHTVPADAARLQQVFWNLLKNAVKFTPSGGRVTLATRDDGGRLKIEVRDTGAGIDADLLPRIFDAFEQGGPETTRQFGGLGLGLAITKILVDLHGGTIRADSGGRGAGATFTLALPTTAAADADPSPGAAGPSEAGRLRVLLIEDHADTAKIMGRLLRRQGMAVRWADSVAAGLRALDGERFDVIVSDLGLPDGSGHDLLRQARAADVATPAIVLSGFGSDRDREQSAAAGFAEHLVKPVDPSRLAAVLRRLVAGATSGNGI